MVIFGQIFCNKILAKYLNYFSLKDLKISSGTRKIVVSFTRTKYVTLV